MGRNKLTHSVGQGTPPMRKQAKSPPKYGCRYRVQPLTKSFAQVEGCVEQQVVERNACRLKPRKTVADYTLTQSLSCPAPWMNRQPQASPYPT